MNRFLELFKTDNDFKKRTLLGGVVTLCLIGLFTAVYAFMEPQEQLVEEEVKINSYLPTDSTTVMFNDKALEYEYYDNLNAADSSNMDLYSQSDRNMVAASGSSDYDQYYQESRGPISAQTPVVRPRSYNHRGSNDMWTEPRVNSNPQTSYSTPTYSEQPLIGSPSKPTNSPKNNTNENNYSGESNDGISYYNGSTGNNNGNQNSNIASNQLYKAQIMGRQILTAQNTSCKIKILEPISIGGFTIPRNTVLLAKANYSQERVFLKVSSFKHNNRVLNVNLSVFDNYGVEGLVVHGGTGAELEGEARDDVGNEIGSIEGVNRIPGSSGIIRKVFTKKVKVVLESEFVNLKVAL